MPTPFLSSVLGLAALILPARARAADDFAASAYFAEREPDGSVRVSIRSGDVSSPAPGAPEGVEWLRFDLRAVSSVAPEGIGGVLELKESIPRLVVRADFQLFAYAGIGVDSAGLGTVGPQGVRILLHGDDNRYRLQSEGATLSTRGSHLAVVTHGRDVEEVFLIDLRGFKPEIEAVLLPGDVKKIEPRSASVTDEAFFFAAERADGWSIFRSPLEPTSGQSLLVAERVAGPFEDVEEYFAASEGGVAFLAGRGSDELDVFVVPNSGPAVNVTQDPGPVLRHRPAEPRLALSPDALSVSYDRRVGAEPETFLHEVVAPGGSGAFQITEDQRFNPYIDQESLIFFDGRGNLVANGITEHGGMAGAGAYALAYAAYDRGYAAGRIKERNVLFPRQAHHDPQAMPVCRVQQPARRYGVDAHGIDAVGSHQGEIPVDDFQRMVLAAVRLRLKRAVCHTPHVEFLFAGE